MSALTEDASFYMIWTKKGHKPRFIHPNFDEAQAEAHRLARLTPGAKFIILKAVCKISVAAPAAGQVEPVP